MLQYVGGVLTFSTQEKGIFVCVSCLKNYIPRAICYCLIYLQKLHSTISMTNYIEKQQQKKSYTFQKVYLLFDSTVLYSSIMPNRVIPAHFRCYEICEMRAAERGRELWVGRVSYQISMAIFLINLEAVICSRAPLCLTLCLSPSDKTSKNSFPFPQSVSLINLCINNWSSPVCFQRSVECSSFSERGGTFCVNHIRVPF